MAKISELGYLGVGAGDLTTWQRLVTTVFGMQVVPGDTSTTCYLRIDHHYHRIELNEYGWGGRVIDDATWQVEYYDSVDSIWGHPQLKTLATGGPPA